MPRMGARIAPERTSGMSAENIITKAIINKFSAKLINGLKLDVALVGGGPSALVAARYLADAGLKTAIFERKLAPGGGTWGGGMLFNEVVVQDKLTSIEERLSSARNSSSRVAG